MSPVFEPTAIQLLPSYHLVLPEPSKYVYSVNTVEFCRQLQLIDDLSSVRPNHCALTFDDCHVSQFRYAFPVLQKLGVRARFFAIVGWIGKRTDFMTWEQLKELVSAGHEVQSHGLSHSVLTRCHRAELSTELSHSRRELEQRLGVAVDAISVPFGRWNHRVVEACSRAGYRRVYTSDPAPPLLQSGVDVLGRFVVRRSTSLAQLRRVLTEDGRELAWLRRRQRYTLLVRASLGERAYFALWSILRARKSSSGVSALQAELR